MGMAMKVAGRRAILKALAGGVGLLPWMTDPLSKVGVAPPAFIPGDLARDSTVGVVAKKLRNAMSTETRQLANLAADYQLMMDETKAGVDLDLDIEGLRSVSPVMKNRMQINRDLVHRRNGKMLRMVENLLWQRIHELDKKQTT